MIGVLTRLTGRATRWTLGGWSAASDVYKGEMVELFATGLRYSVVWVKPSRIMWACLNLGHGYAV